MRKRGSDDVVEPSSDDTKRNSKKRKDRGARIPCPIDPSHMIFESALAKHVLVCPAAMERKETCSREYYKEGTNLGGFGDLGDEGKNSDVGRDGDETTTDLAMAQQLALAVLRVFCSLFPSAVAKSNDQKKQGISSDDDLSRDILVRITEEDIYNALPEVDLSSAEEGIAKDIAKHRVKAGGPRHLHQLQSILGHVRKNELIYEANDSEHSVIEMGAGRGMLGLVTAGAMGAAQTQTTTASSSKVKLYLVERSGTRGKAETKIRTATGDASQDNDDSLRLDRVEVSRIKCDLAHVHMSTALPFLEESGKRRSIVVAKHLCGAGTDLALKSLRDIARSGAVDGCVMATCCHGLCNWKDYVGRDSFLELFRGIGGLSTFSGSDFDQLRRWTSASVLEDSDHPRSAVVANDDDDEHSIGVKSQNIYVVVKQMGLACGGKGLGRACQRLIDYGRTEYIRKHLFHRSSADRDCITADVSLCHYCSSDVTPQNALIVAKRG